MNDIISAALSVICSAAVFMLQRQIKQRDMKAHEQENARAQESRLMLSMIMANNKMSYATAIAVRDKKTNGEMEEAIGEYRDTRKTYLDFINNYAISRLSGEK